MSLENKFETAAKDVKELAKRPNNDDLLSLYSLFKQATDGDVSGKRPGMLDLKGKAKFDSWSKIKGLDKNKAMEDYVSLVEKLKSTHGA